MTKIVYISNSSSLLITCGATAWFLLLSQKDKKLHLYQFDNQSYSFKQSKSIIH